MSGTRIDRIFLPAAIAAIAILTGVQSLSAQNALGNGQALDGNLRIGSGGRNRPSTRGGSNLGNLIVTRNVTDGRGFRGSVGYTAATDFRGETGSDDLFRFRARSALSSLEFISSDPARSGALSLGQAMGIVEYRRATAGEDLNRSLNPLRSYGEYLAVQDRLNQLALTETSMSRTEAASQGRLLSVQSGPDGKAYTFRGSEARGIVYAEAKGDLPLTGLSLYDQARVIQDLNAGIDTAMPGDSFDENEEISEFQFVDGRIEASTLNTDLSGVISTDYRNVLAGVAERLADSDPRAETDLALQMQAHLDSFKALLADLDKVKQLNQNSGTVSQRPGVPEVPVVPQPGSDIAPAVEKPAEELNIMALRHDRTISSLAPEEPGSRFGEIMASGETLLRERRYFQAEREFSRALRFQASHPLALAGLANAQLGAGLRVAAGVTIRNMYTRHPEMIDAVFSTELLPPRERLDDLANVVMYQIENGPASSEAALILAFIGRQTDQNDLITSGIEALEEFGADDPLPIVLRGVWLDEDVTDRLHRLRHPEEIDLDFIPDK